MNMAPERLSPFYVPPKAYQVGIDFYLPDMGQGVGHA